MDILYIIFELLFWPILIVVVISWFVRRKRRKQNEELLDTLADVRVAADAMVRRLERLEERIARLEAGAAAAKPAAAAVAAPPIVVETVVPALREAVVPAVAEAAPAAEIAAAAEAAAERKRTLEEVLGVAPPTEAAPAAAIVVAAEEVAPPEPAVRARWRTLEQRFIENWTGILGAVVIVAGVTFIGVYTALRLEPVFRFLLTLAAGTALAGASFALGRKEQWRDFAAWIRSAGAAIVLFACAAAGGLPGLGLQWISDPWPALALLLAGIGANLYLAYAAGAQVFATLHVLLSLLPLAIVPPTAPSLVIASVVALCGVGLAAYGRWDRHLAAVLGAYLLFHVIWLQRQPAWTDLGGVGYLAAGCAVLVFGAAALVHYRRDYAAASPPPMQVAVHIANWALLALAMFFYMPDEVPRGVALLVFGVTAYRLARRAAALGVPWLQRADTLTAQALVLLALISGFALGASATLVLLVAFAEALAFRWIVERGADEWTDKVADALPICAAALLALAGGSDLVARPDERVGLAVMLLVGAAVAATAQWALRLPRATSTDAAEAQPADDLRRAGQQFFDSPAPVLNSLAGVLLLVSLGGIADRPWMELVALLTVGALLLAWHRTRLPGLLAAAVISLVGAHVLSWDYLVVHRDWQVSTLSVRLVPLAALAALAIRMAGAGVLRQLAVVLLGATIGLAAFLYFAPVSPLIPGVAWLILALVALEVANRLGGRESATVLGLGYAYLVAFALAYALVIVQTPAYVGAVRARALIELFAIAVLAYWWFFRPRETLAGAKPWLAVHPLFLELLLAAFAVTVVVEVQPLWWAVVWAVAALALLLPVTERLLDARSRVYSLLFYWVSVADMAVVMSTMEVPSQRWYEQPEFTSLIAIALQVAWVAAAQRRLVLEDLETPSPVRWVGTLAAYAARRRNLYVYYPLFAGIALFLYWRFDRSLLTLLWSAEAFIVFALSAWLRENQFRYVALAGLAGCVLRLVLIDMAEANLVVRGLVFIGVGALMLGMNAIYNRYRARFEP